MCCVAKVTLVISGMLCCFSRNERDIQWNQHTVCVRVASSTRPSSAASYRGKCLTLQKQRPFWDSGASRAVFVGRRRRLWESDRERAEGLFPSATVSSAERQGSAHRSPRAGGGQTLCGIRIHTERVLRCKFSISCWIEGTRTKRVSACARGQRGGILFWNDKICPEAACPYTREHALTRWPQGKSSFGLFGQDDRLHLGPLLLSVG